MALQWTPLRLSMVAGNEVNSVNRLRPSYRPYRKMADIGVQCDSNDSGMFESPAFSSTVAEINTSEISTAAEINMRVDHSEVDSPSSVTGHPTLSRPHSTGSASSTSSVVREKKRTNSDEDEELDVDAICEDGTELRDLGLGWPDGQTERDGHPHPHTHHHTQPGNKPDDSCGLDCLYFTMKCCECTIL